MIQTEEDVLALPAAQALAWVIAEPMVPPQLHWHAIAEGAAFRATWSEREGPAEERALWAKVSLAAYTYLIRKSGQISGSTFELSAMMLKVSMIRTVPEDPCWDPVGIYDWFRRSLYSATREEIEKLAETPLPEMPHHTMSRLRKIKNKISVLAHLAAHPGRTLPDDMVEWVKLGPRLP